jgi:WXG100 protein secretion system (Wss), protein YukD
VQLLMEVGFAESSDRVQVEVVGPAGRRWLSLPAEEPVGDLLPSLVPLLAGADQTDEPDQDAWVLAPPVGRPLAAARSLRSAGIRAGSLLCLVESQLAEDADGVLPPRALVGMRTPLRRTAASLPRRLGWWTRARAAFVLARERGAERTLGAPARTTLHPAIFTEVRPDPLWRRGWRAWRELDYVARLEAAVTAPRLRRGVTIAVVSAFPNAGRTLVVGLLGTLLAQLRRDRIIAVDPVGDDRSLTSLVVPRPARYLDAVTALPADPVPTLTGIDANLLPGSHGLRVARGEALDRLVRVAGVLLVDCEPGLDGGATREAVQAADQVLVVTDAGPHARAVLGAAVERVRGEARSVLVVANAARARAGPRDAGRLAVRAPDANGLVELPWSPAGAAQLSGGRFEWPDAPRSWRRSTLELAAALAADWARLGLLL